MGIQRGKGEGGFDILVSPQGFLDDAEGDAGLSLDALQPFRRDVFLKERVNLGAEGGAERWERVGWAIGVGVGVRRGIRGGWRSGGSLGHGETPVWESIH